MVYYNILKIFFVPIILILVCINFFNAYSQLNGNYTIGNNAFAEYQNIKEAIDDLKVQGVSGAVTFNILDGTYTNKLVIDFEIIGSSEDNLVIFQSASGDSSKVLIRPALTRETGFPPPPLVALSIGDAGAATVNPSNICFKQLTFDPIIIDTAIFVNVLEIYNAKNIQLINNAFKLSQVNNPIMISRHLAITGNKSYPIIIKGNVFYNADYAISHQSNAIYSSIEYNSFLNQNYAALTISGIANTDDSALLITKNNILYEHPLSVNPDYIGIQVANSNGQTIIESNTIRLMNKAKAGIVITDCSNDNIINNFIYYSYNWSFSGIEVEASSIQNIYYNTIVIFQSELSSSDLTIKDNISGEINIANNLFVNYSNGFCIIAPQSTVFNYSDYNNYHSLGPYLFQINNIPITALIQWKNSFLLDEHSYNVDPVFETEGSYIICDNSLNNKGVMISGIYVDIEGKPRSNEFTDIGAYEYDEPCMLQNNFIHNNENEAFAIYPNPTNGTFVIDLHQTIANTENILIEVYNAVGVLLIKDYFTIINNQIKIDVYDLKSGVLFLKIYSDDNSVYTSRLNKITYD